MFTLGPTTHVTSRAAVMSALWHPLGVNGSCLVTVTSDAILRIWEIDLSNRWSFDNPTTSIDLKRLADGTSLDQDFSASTHANKAFSPDSFEMEVAAAAFASRGSGRWDPMTLWVAMREGDVYALCPLLPQKWAPPPTLIPSLSVAIVGTLGSIEGDPSVAEHQKLLSQQQFEWMGDLDSQEPAIIDGPPDEPVIEVYNRPSRPGVVPRLQGPFELNADPDTGDELDTLITDIMVIGKKTEVDDLMEGEDDDLELDERDRVGASITVICLLSASGQTRIYLELDGIEAQWLPPKKKSRLARQLINPEDPSLLAFQALDTMSPVEMSDDSWPVFSPDVVSRYNLFVTHHAGIIYMSLTNWIFRLEKELLGESEAGSDLRVGLIVNSQSSREKVYAQSTADAAVPLAGAVAIQDPDIGYFLLSATPFDVIALTFESPDSDLVKVEELSEESVEIIQPPPLELHEPRPVFRPSHTFDQPSALPTLLQKAQTSRHRAAFRQEVRLSPLTLTVFTDAHRVLSDETYRLGLAASELFRRCEQLQGEFAEQIRKAGVVKAKVDEIQGSQRSGVSDNEMFEERIAVVNKRQAAINQRLEALRKVVGRSTVRELSAKERAFFEEVKAMAASVSQDESGDGDDPSSSSGRAQPLWKRLDAAQELKDELASEVEAISSKDSDVQSPSPHRAEVKVPSDIRRTKLQQVQTLLDRETALVEAVSSRLQRLQMGGE
jgi:nucleoporin NUP82